MSIGISVFGIPIFNPINLISTNAGFEQDFTGWSRFSGDYSSNNLDIVNSPVHSGLKAFKFGGISPNTYTFRTINNVATGSYTLGCWYLNSSPSGNIYMYRKNRTNGADSLVLLNTLSTTYLQIAFTFSTDAGTLEIGFGIDNATNTNPVYIDDVFLYKN